ncbi:restriction endonuclease subunit S [Porphyromonas gingivalis]|uniref:restriction endonuclease subunit S n=2 Tax=Porphyromonas gingivalis TaxID=837 RepID=UPI000975022D|nr:restriction endonuclease subunit S [Porphyromonas gingivalis]PDP62550.1 restriction endonuclease subunit S [Porphyromonas gingivalis]SJL24212.1 EcoKI restriction-modification system protein HsdS [Porphyromonas gingivalis]
MATNNKIAKCPPLRFPEFADEWKQTTLGETCSVIGGGTPSTDVDDYWNGDIQWFTPSEIGVNKFVSRSERTITEQGMNNSGAKLLPLGTILLTTRATIGEASIATCPCTTNQGCQSLVINRRITTTEFVYQKVETLKRELFSRANGSTFKEISASEVRSIPISLPSLAEQEKIASFLSLIDERIQSCSETIKEIKTLKAGLLSLRVYQADKQYVPLSYFGEMKHGYPFKSTSYDEDGTHRIVTISNVSGARYADMSKCNYLAELPHDIQQHQILSRNDILISLTGNVGRVSFCLADGDLLNQRVGVLSLCDEAYKEYIYQVLSDWRFEMSMVACGQGAAQLNISKSNVEGYLVPYEQSEYQEIGNFFSLLDDRIEIEEELLKQYEMQKKYLLRQMFI